MYTTQKNKYIRRIGLVCFATAVFFFGYVTNAEAGVITKPMHQSGLAGYWAFDVGVGGLIAYDHSGNSNDGALKNMNVSDWVIGPPGSGNALDFDGSNDYIALGSPPELNITGDLTVSFWVKADSATNDTVISWANSHTQFPYHITVDTSYIRFNGNNAGNKTSNVGITTGVWQHVVVTVDGTQLRFYVNGVPDSSNPQTLSTATRNSGDGNLRINRTSAQLDAQLDEIRVYNRPFSQAEVQKLYQSKRPKIRATDLSDTVLYYSFDEGEGKSVSDRGIRGHGGSFNGTIASGSSWVSGKHGSALDFDGLTDYIQVDNIHLPTEDFTYAAWVYFRNDEFIFMSTNAAGGNEFSIDISAATGVLQVRVDDNNITSNSVVPTNEWVHIAATRSGSSVRIYINGTDDGGGTEADTLDFAGCPLFLGIDIDTVSCTENKGNYLDGIIDEAYIYDRGLSADEIAALYASVPEDAVKTKINTSTAGTFVSGLVGHWTFDGQHVATGAAYDSSGNNNTGSREGRVAATIGKFGQAFDFDGVDDWVDAGDVATLDFGTGDFAGCAWIKSTESSTDTIFGKRSDAETGWLFRRDGSTGNINLRLDTGSETDYDSAAFGVSDGQWHHVCFSADRDGDVTFYADGVDVGSSDITWRSGSLDNNLPFCIGANNCDSTGFNEFDGSIDDVRVYNRTLSAKEILQIYGSSP